MNEERGAIRCEQAYAQGKMLNNSAWRKVLPRNITPSDFDMVFDNAGDIIFGELSSSTFDWCELETGQRLAYWDAIRGSRNLAVLCKHSISSRYQINTYTDIEAFSVMYDCQGKMSLKTYKTAKCWQNFITSWFTRSPEWVREQLPGYTPEDEDVDWNTVLERDPEEEDEDEEEEPFIEAVLSVIGGQVVAEI